MDLENGVQIGPSAHRDQPILRVVGLVILDGCRLGCRAFADELAAMPAGASSDKPKMSLHVQPRYSAIATCMLALAGSWRATAKACGI